MQRLRQRGIAALCAVAAMLIAPGRAAAAAAVPPALGMPGAALSAQVAGAAPQRIVSLLPSATEAVCALGACARLVGVDSFSQDPASVQRLPRLGRTFQPDIEGILRLRPDLVLMGNVPAVRQRLQAAGLRVEVVDAATVAQVHAMLQRVDGLLHPVAAAAGAAATPQVTVLWARLQNELQQVAAASQQHRAGRPLRVYLEVDGALFAAGPRSYMGEILTSLGVDNIVPDHGKPFPQLSPEWVLRADPDVIIQTNYAGQQPLAQRPGWARMRALQRGQVCRLNEADSRTVSRPGPRLAAAAQVLARCLPQGAAAAAATEKVTP